MRDVFFLVCDGLKGLPAVVSNVWPQTTVQTCIIHLIRNTFRLASRRDQDALKRDVRPIYTAVNAAVARAALDELAEKWGQRYGAVIRLWENAWEEFIPFLDYDPEIRQVICSTNAIESLNARYRRAVKARGHFPTELAALKCLYLVTRSPRPHRHRPGPLDHAVVESARGAVPVLLPVRFPVPLAEPGVRLSTHRALHGFCRQAWFAFAQGAGMLPRYR